MVINLHLRRLLASRADKLHFLLCLLLFLIVANFINGAYFVPMIAAWLVHESGHLLAGQLCHIRLRPQSSFLGVGLRAETELVGIDEVLVAAGGLVANLLFALLAWLFAARYYYEASLVMLLGNALPVLPLDGGKLVRGFFARHCSRLKLTKVLVYMGQVVALIGALLVIYFRLRLWLLLLPLAVYILAVHEIKEAEFAFAKSTLIYES